MKKMILSILIIGLVIGVTWNLRRTDDSVRASTPQWLKATVAKLQAETAPDETAMEEQTKVVEKQPTTPSETFTYVNNLGRKAILNEKERAEMLALLSSKENIDASVNMLRTVDPQNLRENQKQRMAAGLFLLNALDAKNNPANAHVRAQIAGLMLDPTLDQLEDVNLKRSVVADRVELFMSLKKRYPVDAERITSLASTELQKKMISFATSLYNVNHKKGN